MNLSNSGAKPFGMQVLAITARHEIPGRLYLQVPKACRTFEGAEVRHETLPDIVGQRLIVRQAKIGLLRIPALAIGIEQHEGRMSLAMWRVDDAEIADE